MTLRRRPPRRTETVIAEELEPLHDVDAEKKMSQAKSERSLEHAEAAGDQAEKKKEKPPTQHLPLVVNAAILLAFCCLGGIVYIAAGGNKTFMEAFFVTFNLVANLTMSEMPNDLNHMLTVIYIFVFVTFGVAVLSMCAELAAIELKELFLKIHYFGRKINFRRQPKQDVMDEVEVKELLKIIEEIRKRYPEKETITSLDILKYMHEANVSALNERRDTIAFIPQTMEMLRFADEQDLEDRSISRNDDVAPLPVQSYKGLPSLEHAPSFINATPHEFIEGRNRKARERREKAWIGKDRREEKKEEERLRYSFYTQVHEVVQFVEATNTFEDRMRMHLSRLTIQRKSLRGYTRQWTQAPLHLPASSDLAASILTELTE